MLLERIVRLPPKSLQFLGVFAIVGLVVISGDDVVRVEVGFRNGSNDPKNQIHPLLLGLFAFLRRGLENVQLIAE
jgi:hypothetical protein